MMAPEKFVREPQIDQHPDSAHLKAGALAEVRGRA